MRYDHLTTEEEARAELQKLQDAFNYNGAAALKVFIQKQGWDLKAPFSPVSRPPLLSEVSPADISEASLRDSVRQPILERPLDLSNAPPFLLQWFAYISNIPTAMKQVPRWTVWRKHEDGRKIPYRVLDGRHWLRTEKAKSDDPSTWTTFDGALFCFLNAGGHLGGLSFALGDGWCGFDHDNVITDGVVDPQAESWLTRLGGYREISQSGNGEKNILRGTLDTDFLGTAETGRQFKNIPAGGMATEVYDKRRFFFLTGSGSGEPLENQGQIDAICAELMALKEQHQPKKRRTVREQRPSDFRFSDDAILQKIRNSKQAVKFETLWSGQIGAYDSASEADMALTSMLMWWCNNDVTQVERLFEQSGLAKREKWDREDYRDRTLAKTVRSDGYTPRIPRGYTGAAQRIKEQNNGK